MADASPLAVVSMLDQLAEPGFRASVITTYSCYLPFYEQVVLRRLVAAGCTHNIVLVDAARLGDALSVAELRPRLAGTAYTLVPVSRSGAFHPKLLLQVGPTKGALFVGSHNLTLSGFGLNDELTSVFRAEPPNPRAAAAPFHVARDYLRSFLPDTLPEIAAALDAVFENAPWLNGPASIGTAARALLAATGDAGALWDRVRPMVPAHVTRGLVVSPFFDDALAFVQRLMADVKPASLTIAIDPSTAVVPADASTRLPGVRFVNLAGCIEVPRRRAGARPYLHAKALWFESPAGEVLVTGSANASAPAFLDGPGRRNAEAAVVDTSPGVAESLGLLSLFDAPALSITDWAKLASAAANKEADSPRSTVLLATVTDDGFVLSGTVPALEALSASDQDGRALGGVTVEALEPVVRVLASPDIREAAAFLFGSSQGRAVTVLVHHPDEIASHTATDSRKALNQALGALDDDPAQIEALLRVTEKVIFDVEDNVATTMADAPRATPSPGTGPTAPSLSTLAIEAQGRRAPRKRGLARGDLAYLLDVLIRRLGDGLPPTAPTSLSEQDEIGGDQEHGGDIGAAASAVVDLGRLAHACRSKAKKLGKRMLSAIDACKQPGQAQRVVVQFAAVAGVLRALALAERRPEWRRARHQLVDRDALLDLATGVTIAFLARGEGLLAQARREAGAEFDELGSALGLLATLLFLCGIDATAAPPRADMFEAPPDESAHWLSVQLFAILAPSLALEGDAQATLTQSVERFVTAGSWLPRHLDLADALVDLETSPPTAAGAITRPQRGDWAVVPAGLSPRVRVILKVLPALAGAQVVVADYANESGQRVFVAKRLCVVPRGMLGGEQWVGARCR